MSHVIDCDVAPYLPEHWMVEEHCKGGRIEGDSLKVSLYLSPNQEGDKAIVGSSLQEELKDKPVLNANVLDWYLAHPELIPEEWKDKVIFFWGTIYRGSDNARYVRFLCWREGWHWRSRWLEYKVGNNCPAALAK